MRKRYTNESTAVIGAGSGTLSWCTTVSGLVWNWSEHTIATNEVVRIIVLLTFHVFCHTLEFAV